MNNPAVRLDSYWDRVKKASQFAEDLLELTSFADPENNNEDKEDSEFPNFNYYSDKNHLAMFRACDRFQVRFQDLTGCSYSD